MITPIEQATVKGICLLVGLCGLVIYFIVLIIAACLSMKGNK